MCGLRRVSTGSGVNGHPSMDSGLTRLLVRCRCVCAKISCLVLSCVNHQLLQEGGRRGESACWAILPNRVVLGATACPCRDAPPRTRHHQLRAAIPLRLSCSDFRGVAAFSLGGHRSGHKRLHGEAAVNVVLHSAMAAMAAMLLAHFMLSLLVAAFVLGMMPPLHGAARRYGGGLL